MPTYAYHCTSCNFEFEEWQKISDEPLVRCPSCKKDTLVRDIGGGAALIFKGSGFYQTDYKKTGAGKTSEESSPASDKKPETPDKPKPAKPEGEKSSNAEQGPRNPKSKN